MVQIFFQSMLIGYSGALMPGSLLTYTIDKSIKTGARAGLLISIGHSLLELMIVILLLAGAGSFLSAEAVQTAIGLLGGLVLIFLGVGMVKDVYRNKISISLEAQGQKGAKNLVAGGFVISASNPYFLFWWAVVGLGLLLNAYTAFGMIGVILFYFGHILADISWYCFVAFLLSKTRRFISQNVYRIVIAVLGVCLIGFGSSFIFNALERLFPH